jgi:hypothetical protein
MDFRFGLRRVDIDDMMSETCGWTLWRRVFWSVVKNKVLDQSVSNVVPTFTLNRDVGGTGSMALVTNATSQPSTLTAEQPSLRWYQNAS